MKRKPLPSKRLLAEAFFNYVLNPVPGVCPVKHCARGSANREALCHKHQKKRWRTRHPERSSFRALQDHARTRGIVFTITFADFMAAAKDFPFHQDKPAHYKDYLSIDRIDNKRGYEPGNIQALTVSENAMKGERLEFSPEGKYYKALAERPGSETEPIYSTDSCPPVSNTP